MKKIKKDLDNENDTTKSLKELKKKFLDLKKFKENISKVQPVITTHDEVAGNIKGLLGNWPAKW